MIDPGALSTIATRQIECWPQGQTAMLDLWQSTIGKGRASSGYSGRNILVG